MKASVLVFLAAGLVTVTGQSKNKTKNIFFCKFKKFIFMFFLFLINKLEEGRREGGVRFFQKFGHINTIKHESRGPP
jgi:hypothetical protein